MLDKNHKKDFLSDYSDTLLPLHGFKKNSSQEHIIPFKTKTPSIDGYSNSTQGSFRLFF